MPPSEQEIKAEQERVRALVKSFLADSKPIERRLREFLKVFLLESIHTRGDTKDVRRCETGKMILASSDEVKRAVFVAILKALKTAPRAMDSWEPNVWGQTLFVHDYYWGFLIEEFLKSRLPATEECSRQVLIALAGLAGRWDDDYGFLMDYGYPFAKVVRYLDKQILPWSEELQPEINALVKCISATVLGRLGRARQYGGIERKSLVGDPGRLFVKKDRDAIRLVQSWLDGKGPSAKQKSLGKTKR